MKLAIVGSRGFNDYDLLCDTIEEHFDIKEITHIVSGGARGADALGERFADDFGIGKIIFPAQWNLYGKRAGFLRNRDIIKTCDQCVAFWDGESHGTKHDIELCEEYNKPCLVIKYK